MDVESGDDPEAGQPCRLLFKVVDSGCGFGNMNPQRLLHQFYAQYGRSNARHETLYFPANGALSEITPRALVDVALFSRVD